nr:MAG TPA: hypothetical protein [Caudoviricetes sp.]
MKNRSQTSPRPHTKDVDFNAILDPFRILFSNSAFQILYFRSFNANKRRKVKNQIFLQVKNYVYRCVVSVALSEILFMVY